MPFEQHRKYVWAVGSILEHKKETIMVEASVGDGSVFAVGDPWLYNEYVDGRKLPAEFENFKAANDLVKWALSHATKPRKATNAKKK